jgi:hypothetical protein
MCTLCPAVSRRELCAYLPNLYSLSLSLSLSLHVHEFSDDSECRNAALGQGGSPSVVAHQDIAFVTPTI